MQVSLPIVGGFEGGDLDAVEKLGRESRARAGYGKRSQTETRTSFNPETKPRSPVWPKGLCWNVRRLLLEKHRPYTYALHFLTTVPSALFRNLLHLASKLWNTVFFIFNFPRTLNTLHCKYLVRENLSPHLGGGLNTTYASSIFQFGIFFEILHERFILTENSL